MMLRLTSIQAYVDLPNSARDSKADVLRNSMMLMKLEEVRHYKRYPCMEGIDRHSKSTVTPFESEP